MTPEELYKRIEDFDSYFSEDFVDPMYAKAWELNKKHSIRLNSLPKDSALLVQKIISENQPKVILEIGTSGGYSALHMAEKLNSGQIWTIEKSLPKAEIARVHFEACPFAQIIHQIFADADEVTKNISDYVPTPIDLVFIDADRKKYLQFLKNIEPHLSEHAIILADNVSDFKDEVTDFVEYMKNNSQFKTEIIETENGLLCARKI